MAVNISCLARASASLNMLETVRCTHSDPFAAIAELVDNSYDARAKNCYVSYDKPTSTLEFLDDGWGMSPREVREIITFGHSDKTTTDIGRYGVGLKAGAFHLGKELMVLTKKDDILTVMLISTKFHNRNEITNQIYVPCISFNTEFETLARYEDNVQRHNAQLEMIKEYGPLGKRSLESLFAKITGETGTLVIIDWIRKSTIMSGNYILDFGTDDITIEDDSRPKHHQSLRTFLSMLYLRPKMRIHLQGSLVHPTKITQSWMAKFKAEIPTSVFKDISKRCQEGRERDLKILDLDMALVANELKDMQPEELATLAGRGKKAQLDDRLEEIKAKTEALKNEEQQTEKLFKNSTVKLFCGVQTTNRADNGIHFFMNNRLIDWGYKAMPFFKNKRSIGVCAFVNLDPAIFRPTASKQEFGKSDDFKLLVKECNKKLNDFFEYFETYWIENALGRSDDPVAKFWNAIGYADAYLAQGVQRQLAPDQDRLLELKKKESARWFLCCRCRIWRRDTEWKVEDFSNSDQLECNDVDGHDCEPLRFGNAKFTDDEGFEMCLTEWTKIKESLQKSKASSGSTSTLRDDGPSSAPSTSGPPISVIRNPTRRSELVAQRSDGPSSSRTAPIFPRNLGFLAPKDSLRGGSLAPSDSSSRTPASSSSATPIKGHATPSTPASNAISSSALQNTQHSASIASTASRLSSSSTSNKSSFFTPKQSGSKPNSTRKPVNSGHSTPKSHKQPVHVDSSNSESSVHEEDSDFEPEDEDERTPAPPSIRQPIRSSVSRNARLEEVERRLSRQATSQVVDKKRVRRQLDLSDDDEDSDPATLPTSRRQEDDALESSDNEIEDEQSSKPVVRRMEKANKRRKYNSSSSSEEEEDEPQQKSQSNGAKRTAAKKPEPKKQLTRNEAMEASVNAFLTELGLPSVPANGEFELDLVSIFKQQLRPFEAARDEVEQKKKLLEKDVSNVLELAVGMPSCGLVMPRDTNTFDKLEGVARQIRSKKPQGRKTQSKK